MWHAFFRKTKETYFVKMLTLFNTGETFFYYKSRISFASTTNFNDAYTAWSKRTQFNVQRWVLVQHSFMRGEPLLKNIVQ